MARGRTRSIREHAGRHRYGVLLLLILVSLGFQLASPDSDAAQALTVLLLATTLIVAVRASLPHRGVRWVINAIIAVALTSLAVSVILVGHVDNLSYHVLSLLIVAIVPPLVAVGIVRALRDERAVTVHTMYGVLCIYLLLGAMFAFLYGAVGELGSTPFFSQLHHPGTPDYLYFSFSTLTTTGYGDLTPATDLGRALVITEALIGQIYLVTIVAVIVANLARGRPARRNA